MATYSFEFQSTQTWNNTAKTAFDKWIKTELEKKRFTDVKFIPTGKFQNTGKVIFLSNNSFENVKATVVKVLDETGHMDFKQERETMGDITHYHTIKEGV